MEYVIWGAGERGARIFPHLNPDSVKAFIDIDSNKIGNEYLGKAVISFEEYKWHFSNCYIIISYSFEYEIVEVLKDNNINKYFLMSECPGELQETNPRNLLKDYICNSVGKEREYTIYGCTLYSFILREWLIKKLEKDVRMVPHVGIDEGVLSVLKGDKEIQGYIASEEVESIDGEILVTVEEDIPYLKSHVNAEAIITNVYDCSDEMMEYHNPQIEEFKDIHLGQRCFIVATGPSLRIEDLDTLAKHKAMCISMNRIWYAFDKTTWRPDYYVVGDYRNLKQDAEILEQMPINYKFVADTYGPYWEKEHTDSIIKYHFHYEYLPDRMPKFSEDFSRKCYHGTTITYVCLQLAVYMGFTEIYLLGVDATRSASGYQDASSHFCKEYLNRATSSLRTFDREPRLAYRAARNYAERKGIHIYNATRGGELEVYERVDFDRLFEDG